MPATQLFCVDNKATIAHHMNDLLYHATHPWRILSNTLNTIPLVFVLFICIQIYWGNEGKAWNNSPLECQNYLGIHMNDTAWNAVLSRSGVGNPLPSCTHLTKSNSQPYLHSIYISTELLLDGTQVIVWLHFVDLPRHCVQVGPADKALGDME